MQKHPRTINAFGSALPDCANLLVKIPGLFAPVSSLYTGIIRGWLRDVATGTDLIPVLLKRAVVSQQDLQPEKLTCFCFPHLLANFSNTCPAKNGC